MDQFLDKLDNNSSYIVLFKVLIANLICSIELLLSIFNSGSLGPL